MRSFYAFSVHHFIGSVGADAGFAAIIGLAILVLLYFAQARETATLREQAYQSAQRVQQLEARLAQLSRLQAPQPASAVTERRSVGPGFPARPVFSRPAAARVGAAADATAPPLAAPLGAPAGVGAPALTAATRLIPVGVPPAPAPAMPAAGDQPGVELPAFAGVADAAPAAARTAAAAIAPGGAAVARPAAATAAGVAATRRGLPGSELGPAPSVGGNGAGGDEFENGGGHGRPSPIGVQPPSRVGGRADAGAPAANRGATPPRLLSTQAEPRRGAARVFAVLLAVLAVGGAVAVVLALTSGGATKQQAASRSSTGKNVAASRRQARAVAFQPSSVAVEVLNGTATAGLAGTLSDDLGRDGYRTGTPGNAADQTHATTIVAYMPDQKPAALHVAASLGLGSTSVQPIDQTTQQVACPQGTRCVDEVVVTVGSDLSSRT
ncbi:MAG: LytR C-terminal domain-containing protein [Solirubrobacteraceae bacterium]|jgi:hypothetical protein